MTADLREMAVSVGDRLMDELRRIVDEVGHELRSSAAAEVELRRSPYPSVAVAVFAFAGGVVLGAAAVSLAGRARRRARAGEQVRDVRVPEVDAAELDRFSAAVSETLPPPI